MLLFQADPQVCGYPKPKLCGDDECPTETHKLKDVLDILTSFTGAKMRMAIVFSALAAFGGKSSSSGGWGLMIRFPVWV